MTTETKPLDERAATLAEIIKLLKPHPPEDQYRIMRAVAVFLGLRDD